MRPISSIGELETLDFNLSFITEGLSIKPGSLFRIAQQYLPNWGVEVTEANRAWIEERSLRSYVAEWKYGGAEFDAAIERAVQRAGLTFGNDYLNTLLAEMAVQIMLALHDEKRVFCVCDLGAGAGSTSEALLDRLEHVLGVTTARAFARHFLEMYLIEPSMRRLDEANTKLDHHKLKPKSVELTCAPHTHIGRLNDREFDLLISSAVFHHFPEEGAYLRRLWHKVSDGPVEKGVNTGPGVLLIGDWYHMLCHHPAYVGPLLQALGISPEKLEAFNDIFHVEPGDEKRLDASLTSQQLDSKKVAMNYLSALGEEMRSVQNAQFEFLEALESFPDRKRKINDAGFETDIKELREKHKGFVSLASNVRRAYPNNDLTTVLSAAKKPVGRRKAAGRIS
jgi:hypothetical protein